MWRWWWWWYVGRSENESVVVIACSDTASAHLKKCVQRRSEPSECETTPPNKARYSNQRSTHTNHRTKKNARAHKITKYRPTTNRHFSQRVSLFLFGYICCTAALIRLCVSSPPFCAPPPLPPPSLFQYLILSCSAAAALSKSVKNSVSPALTSLDSKLS